MAKQYYSVLTTYGSQQLATAIATRQPLNITHFAVGDGNGQAVTPDVSRTALVHEVHRATVSAVSRDPRNNKQVIFELTIPEDVGGFHIREMGIFDSQNKLIAYANCPESFKPTLSSGSGKVQVMRMILLVESSDAVTMKVDDTVIFVTRGQLTPKKITAESQNGVDNDGHSHEIESASTTVKGIVKLNSDTNSDSETEAATPKAVKTLAGKITQVINMLANYIPNSKKSSAVDSNSEDTIGTSKAVKLAYDRAVEAEKKGLPVGAVLGFPKEIAHPQGFLKCDGEMFDQATFPDLYRVLGNKNRLPNLQRSDVGMLVYFPQDSVPAGWLECNGETISTSEYPELARYLSNKYGSNKLPNAEDRFIRNAGNGLRVGQTQDDSFEHYHGIGRVIANNDAGLIIGSWEDQNHRSIIVHGQEAYIDIRNVNGDAESGGSRPLRTARENAQGEVRPKAIAFKLCIKAVNAFDDVVFWIKAFGEVLNAGALDASRIAQNLQNKADRNHRHTTSEIINFDSAIAEAFTREKRGDTEIRKFPDGTMIQIAKVRLTDNKISTKQYFTWAMAFTEKPRVFPAILSENGNLDDVTVIVGIVDRESTNSRCFFVTKETSAVLQPGFSIEFLAIGRWK